MVQVSGEKKGCAKKTTRLTSRSECLGADFEIGHPDALNPLSQIRAYFESLVGGQIFKISDREVKIFGELGYPEHQLLLLKSR